MTTIATLVRDIAAFREANPGQLVLVKVSPEFYASHLWLWSADHAQHVNYNRPIAKFQLGAHTWMVDPSIPFEGAAVVECLK